VFRHRLVSREDACKARPARSHCDNAISYRQKFSAVGHCRVSHPKIHLSHRSRPCKLQQSRWPRLTFRVGSGGTTIAALRQDRDHLCRTEWYSRRWSSLTKARNILNKQASRLRSLDGPR
jgi:hypothetical protein